MAVVKQTFENLPKSCDKWEPYLDVYEKHLGRYFYYKPYNIVEVGTQKGGSLHMWASLFSHPETTITGIDVDPECAKLDYGHDPNIDVVIGDQGDPKFWDEFLADRPPIHIFIDDGGHFMDQQILTFTKVFPTMPIGSTYICEDTHTSYMAYNGGGLEKQGTFIEFAKSMIDFIHVDWWEAKPSATNRETIEALTKDLTSIHFYDSMVVFEKFGKKEMKRVQPKGFDSAK